MIFKASDSKRPAMVEILKSHIDIDENNLNTKKELFCELYNYRAS